MKILVTGGAGFIGSAIIDSYLRAGHTVGVMDNLSTGHRTFIPEGVRFYHVDMRDSERLAAFFDDFRPEVVNHHAALVDVTRSVTSPSADAAVNVLGSLNLLECALRSNARKFIFASSGGAVYGEPVSLPVAETHPIQPISPYGVSKYSFELYLDALCGKNGLERTVLRYANVYGPRQSPSGEAGVVAIFATQLLQGRQPRIFGDGTKTRDYVFVDDVARANLAALKTGSGGTFNIGSGIETSDMQVFSEIQDALGLTIEPSFSPARPGEIYRTCVDNSEARAGLGWSPTISFGAGIRRAADYYRSHAKLFGSEAARPLHADWRPTAISP